MTSKTPSPRMKPSSMTGITASSAGVVRPSRQASSAVATRSTSEHSHTRGWSEGRSCARLRPMTDETGPPRGGSQAGRRRPVWLPPLAGWLTAIAGLLNVASALTPNLAERARVLLHVEDADFVPLAHALALSAGVALLVLAV